MLKLTSSRNGRRSRTSSSVRFSCSSVATICHKCGTSQREESRTLCIQEAQAEEQAPSEILMVMSMTAKSAFDMDHHQPNEQHAFHICRLRPMMTKTKSFSRQQPLHFHRSVSRIPSAMDIKSLAFSYSSSKMLFHLKLV